MIRTRFNPDPQAAKAPLEEVSSKDPPSLWIQQGIAKLARGPSDAAFIVLLGATDLVGFRLRVAQSHYRSDALPSFFSHALLALRKGERISLLHAPLFPAEPGSVPRRNGIEKLSFAALDRQPGLYANLALLYLPLSKVADLFTAAQNLQRARLADDFVSPIPTWLAYVWLCNGHTNPLLNGVGLPSAMFVEACYAACERDLVPGASQRIICPEAIWQAVRFWSKSFPGVKGRFELRQPDAAASLDYAPEK